MWEKPDLVELLHWDKIITLNTCETTKSMCFEYNGSTLTVYTNKFSKIVYYKKQTVVSGWGGGWWHFLQKDYLCLLWHF